MTDTFNGYLLRDKNTKKYLIAGVTYKRVRCYSDMLTDDIQKIYLYKTEKNTKKSKDLILNDWREFLQLLDRAITETSTTDWFWAMTRDEMIEQAIKMQNEGLPDIEIVPFSFTI